MKYNDSYRRYLHILLVALFLLPAFKDSNGESVSRKKGEEIAALFFRKAGISNEKKPRLIYDGRRFTSQRLFPPFYLYSNSGGGYVVVAADNKAFPILGYSLSGSFANDGIPSAMQQTFASYAREIENIRYDGRVPEEAISAWGDLENHISRLLKNEDATERWFNMSDSVAGEDIRLRYYATEYPDVMWHQDSPLFTEDSTSRDFSLFEDFIEQTALEREERERIFEERLNPTEEIVVPNGEGRYLITLPENAVSGSIFNMAGMLISRLHFKETPLVAINLDKETAGVYIFTLTGESGKSYSFKLLKRY